MPIFDRDLIGDDVAIVVPRLTLTLDGRWDDTEVDLPAGRWCDRLTGRSRGGGPHPVADLLEAFPVALLARE